MGPMKAMAKLLLETLRSVDGGKVECDVMTPDGAVVKGEIAASFFEDFMGAPEPALSPAKRTRIVRENAGYLEAEAERQWRQGHRALVIR